MMAFGESIPAELLLMVSKKMNAMEEAKAIIARGGNPLFVIENCQKIVAAKVARLSALKMSELERAASEGSVDLKRCGANCISGHTGRSNQSPKKALGNRD